MNQVVDKFKNFFLVKRKIDELVNFINKEINEGWKEEKVKHYILDYINDHEINSREICNWLTNNQINSNYIYLLGYLNYQGISICVNKQKAFELYQKAANLESSFGINNLASCYKNGTGTGVNEQKAFELYQKAANLENLSAVKNLAYCYKYGVGTSIDEQKANELYQKAANLEKL
jgi:TPR repeat protein